MSVVVAQRYELLEQVGEGGAATVWLGRDLRPDRGAADRGAADRGAADRPDVGLRDVDQDRLVAVKILSADVANDPDAMERFWTEIGLAASFHEDGIARILDHGVFPADGASKPYIVMVYLPGGTLAQRLRSSRPEVADVVGLAAGILHGLEPIHRRGLSHGDIRASHVMFDARGRVTLVDFGMARVLGEPAQVLGEPAQVPGDQALGGRAQGEPAPRGQAPGAHADARDDVYAVGALMFEALTGESGSLRDPSAVDPTIPADLARIVRRALSRRPEDRFADAAEMLAEIRELDLLTVPAQRPGAGANDFDAAPDAVERLGPPLAALPPSHPGNHAPRQQQRTSLTWTLADMGRRASRHLGARLSQGRPSIRGLDAAQITRWVGPWLQAQQVLCQYDTALGYWRIPDRLVVWAPPAEIPPGAELESLIRAVDHVAGRRLLQRLAQSDTAEVRLPRLSIVLERVPDGDLTAEAWFSGTPAPDRRGEQLLAVEIGAAQRLALEMTVEIRQAGTWTAQSTSVVAEGLTFGTGAWVDVTYAGPGLGRIGPEALKVVGVADGSVRAFVGNAAGIRLHDAPTGGLGKLTGGRPVWRREVPHGATVELTAGDHVYFPEVEDRLRLVFA